MSSSKRLVFLSAIAAVNLIFTIKEISFATQSGSPSVTANLAEAVVSDTALAASPAMPQAAGGKETNDRSIVAAKFTATAYTNDPAETQDLYPGITASGTHTRPGVAASNVLPFGTKFRIPKYFGSKIFTVEDRMNERFNGQKIVDIWMEGKNQAENWGKRAVQLEIL